MGGFARQLGGRSTSPLAAAVTAGRGGFSVASQFAANEQGAWYDPSDLSSLFQDSAGTTPVTAVEQPVGLVLDKRFGLVRGVELVTNGDFSNGITGWTEASTAPSTFTVSGGSGVLTGDGTNNARARTSFATTAGQSYELTLTKSGAAGLLVGSTAGASDIFSTSATGNISRIFVATGSTTHVQVSAATAGSQTFDNLSVKALPGNHASQATTASKPVLSARVNLLTQTEAFDNAIWIKGSGGTGSVATVTSNAATAPDGTQTADLIRLALNGGTTSADRSYVVQNSLPTVTGATYTNSIYVKAETAGDVGKVIGYRGVGGTYLSVTLTAAWQRIELPQAALAGTSTIYAAELRGASGITGVADSVGFYVWGAQLESGTTATRYQRVNTATDYDSAGFPYYLNFDGVDDFLVTGNIDFTATDKMTVWAGVHKASDAARGMLLELGNTVAGAIRLEAPNTPANTDFLFASGGSIAGAAFTTATGRAAPYTAVLSGAADIGADSCVLRVNGSAFSNSADQGTGNYSNNPLYIGRRGGMTLPFNGRIYSLIVRGAASTAAQIASTERRLATKTGVTLP